MLLFARSALTVSLVPMYLRAVFARSGGGVRVGSLARLQEALYEGSLTGRPLLVGNADEADRSPLRAARTSARLGHRAHTGSLRDNLDVLMAVRGVSTPPLLGLCTAKNSC